MKKILILFLFSPFLFLYSLYSDTVFLYKEKPYTVKDLVGVDISNINTVIARFESSGLTDMLSMYMPPALSPYAADWSDLRELLKHELNGVVQTFIYNRAFELLLEDHPTLREILLKDNDIFDKINEGMAEYAYRNSALAYALKNSDNRIEFEKILNTEREKNGLHCEIISDKRYEFILGFKNNTIFINDLFPCVISGEYAPWLVEYFRRYLPHYIITKAYEINYNSIKDYYLKYDSKYQVLGFSLKEDESRGSTIDSLERIIKEFCDKNKRNASEKELIDLIKSNKSILNDLESVVVQDIPGAFLVQLYPGDLRDSLFEMGRVFPNHEKNGHYFFVFNVIESEYPVDIERFRPGYFVYGVTKRYFLKGYVEDVLRHLEMKWDISVPSAEYIAGTNVYPIELKR
jgi:hypothetical protein